jgi:hypothetical protein
MSVLTTQFILIGNYPERRIETSQRMDVKKRLINARRNFKQAQERNDKKEAVTVLEDISYIMISEYNRLSALAMISNESDPLSRLAHKTNVSAKLAKNIATKIQSNEQGIPDYKIIDSLTRVVVTSTEIKQSKKYKEKWDKEQNITKLQIRNLRYKDMSAIEKILVQAFYDDDFRKASIALRSISSIYIKESGIIMKKDKNLGSLVQAIGKDYITWADEVEKKIQPIPTPLDNELI